MSPMSPFDPSGSKLGSELGSKLGNELGSEASEVSAPLVFMFPGQSSRYPGMLDRLAELHRPNAELLAWSSDLLGRDLAAHYSADAGDDAFARNVDVQVGVFLANHMFLQTLEAAGIEAELSLGLSLGEWNHLVHIGAVSFEQALRAVEQRGRCYDEGPRGWMAAIQPIGDEDLAEVVTHAAKHGVLEVVNLNSPRQHVVAGERAAVEAAVEHAEGEFYAQPRIIERNVPMHSSLFRAVGQRFGAYLEQIEFERPRLPYLPNRLGRMLHEPDPGRADRAALDPRPRAGLVAPVSRPRGRVLPGRHLCRGRPDVGAAQPHAPQVAAQPQVPHRQPRRARRPLRGRRT